MKSGRIFWALFFITIGVLGLLNNIFGVEFCWESVIDYWPLVLVLIGLGVMFRDPKYKWMIVGGAGFLVGLVLFASVNRGCGVLDREWDGEPAQAVHQELSLTRDSTVARASFSFDAGAGKFTMRDTTSDFVYANVNSSIGPYELNSETTDSLTHVTLSMQDHSIHWQGKMRNQVDIRLNTAPVWDMDFDIGAAKAEFDLSPYVIRNLSIDAGAASLNITLGNKADLTFVDVETGASSIKIRVPKDVACELRTDAAMSSKHFDGFEPVGDGEYRSAGYASATKKMVISISAGVSSIRVERY